jgi:hypothetical protein
MRFVSLKLHSLFFLIFFTSTILLAQGMKEPDVFNDWELVKDNKGVQVYVRWKEVEPGRDGRQLKCEMILPTSLSAVVATIKDEKEIFRWGNRLITYYNFNITSDYEWNAYSEFQITWPLDNEDLVTRNHLSQDRTTRAILLELKDDSGKVPLKKDVERIPLFEGSWEIIPVEKGRVKIVYKIFTGQKPFLPRWIIDPVIQNGLWKTLFDMQTVILEKNNSGIRLDYIIE